MENYRLVKENTLLMLLEESHKFEAITIGEGLEAYAAELAKALRVEKYSSPNLVYKLAARENLKEFPQVPYSTGNEIVDFLLKRWNLEVYDKFYAFGQEGMIFYFDRDGNLRDAETSMIMNGMIANFIYNDTANLTKVMEVRE